MSSLRKILILDNDCFGKICSAILNEEGFHTSLACSVEEVVQHASNYNISLIVSNYSHAKSLMKSQLFRDIPKIILTNEFNEELTEAIQSIENTICLVKPLDFERFRYIVCGIMNGYLSLTGGNIIA
jgi:DNA-binding NtrC family response regulator